MTGNPYELYEKERYSIGTSFVSACRSIPYLLNEDMWRHHSRVSLFFVFHLSGHNKAQFCGQNLLRTTNERHVSYGLPGPRSVPYCQVFPSTPQKRNMAAQNTVRFGMSNQYEV